MLLRYVCANTYVHVRALVSALCVYVIRHMQVLYSSHACAGPLYHTAMWNPESIWGELGRDLHNTRHTESNMLLRAMDKEMMHLHEEFALDSDGECVARAKRGAEPYGEHNKLRSIDIETEYEFVTKASEQRRRFNTREQHSYLHKFYIGGDERSTELWDMFIQQRADKIVAEKGWPDGDASRNEMGGWEFSHKALFEVHEAFERWALAEPGLSGEDKRLARQLPLDYYALSSITVNKQKYKEGDWILVRPCEDEDLVKLPRAEGVDYSGLPAYGVPRRMWFGQVKGLFHHTRYTTPELIMNVEWHESVASPHGPFDVDLMSPVVNKIVTEKDNPFFAATSVLPWPKMIALKHPIKAQQLVLISKTWLPLAAANMPMSFPKLMRYPTD